jgi:hypothetical protein
VASLLESEWRQGAVLPHNLLPVGTLPVSVTSDTKLVVISHDCDLVNSSYEVEPFFEIFVARPKASDARDGRVFKGKNPRRLQFVALQNGESRLYEIDVHEKYRVDRRLLEAGTRDTTIRIGESDVLMIAKWAARRYHRPSLPTAFMDRIAPIRTKLGKKLERDGEDIVNVYAALNTLDELPGAEPYRIILRVVITADVCEDDAREQRANGVVSEIQKLLALCKGISLEDARLVTESEITLDEARHMNRWDFDYLSPEEERAGE